MKNGISLRQFGKEETARRRGRMKTDTDETKDSKHNKSFLQIILDGVLDIRKGESEERGEGFFFFPFPKIQNPFIFKRKYKELYFHTIY